MDAKALAQQLKGHLDIVDVVGRQVSLKRVGRNYRGLCPFHGEKTPSFYVHPQQSCFFCYGCKTGGDVVRFIERHRGLSFIEACEYLISEFSLPVQLNANKSSSRADQKKQLEPMKRMALFASHIYTKQLERAAQVLKYLNESRKLPPKTINFFQLGASGFGARDTLYAATQKRLANVTGANEYLKAGEKIGLWGKKGAQFEDRFLERVMIPIRDDRGQVVGFGSRTLSTNSNVPKYINSAESALFQKRNVLYGFFENHEGIRTSKQILLVEGYFDVMKLWAHGIQNACATMGTTLSQQWVKRLQRITDDAILIFDGDDAGLQAMAKHAEIFFKQRWEPRVMILPDQLDPDSYFDSHDAESFMKLARQARRYFDFYFLYEFERVQHAHFDLMALFQKMVSILGQTCGYSVSVSRLEGYLDAADLGHEARKLFMAKLRSFYKKDGQRERRKFEPTPSLSPHRVLQDEITLLFLVFIDLELLEPATLLAGKGLKEKGICGLIQCLNEYKEVLQNIPDVQDRLQFIKYTVSPEQGEKLVFDLLSGLDAAGFKDESTRRDMFNQIIQRLEQKADRKKRKLALMDFKQQYTQGQMSWDEVVQALQKMQEKHAQVE